MNLTVNNRYGVMKASLYMNRASESLYFICS